MAERMMGIENEYAFTAIGRCGAIADRPLSLEALNKIAGEMLVNLPSLGGAGIFVQNGGRLYCDCATHEEWCTPECTQPWDIVRYLKAGERILVDLAAELRKRKRLRSATFYRCNVDYSGSGTTWGTHESHLHLADPKILPNELIPFLVSRVIITGSGGFDPLTTTGCFFTLSPRAYHIKSAISNESTRARGIYHTKDESLSREGYHRLHILIGESLCSDLGNWLKMATTALSVAMAEAGLAPGRDVTLAAPVEALRAFANDPTCRATATTVSSASISALQIQRHYLELAQKHISAPWMPSWAPAAVDQWDSILRKLDDAPDGVASCLDWSIKRQVFASHIQRRGFTWESLDQWSHLAGLLANELKFLKPPLPTMTLSTAFVTSPDCPLRDSIRQLHSYMAERRLQWEQMDAFFKLRLELFEIDTRFGELGGRGIFDLLDAAGVIRHRFPGVDNIEDAITNPPATGRAKARGTAIRALAGNRTRYGCDWEWVHDNDSSQILDLGDPWVDQAQWREDSPSSDRPPMLHRLAREVRNRVRESIP